MQYLLALFLAVMLVSAAVAQKINGRVIDVQTNEPLEFVSVFINTTTVGAMTNAKGEFSLTVSPGKYELIVSYTGYEPIIYALDTKNLPGSFLFKLQAKDNKLNEVAITAERDANWYRNLDVFKEQFLGKSELARQCKLLNPETLIITFEPETGILQVKARDMLQIENYRLGYKVKYLLVDFKAHLKDRYVSYLGYPNYVEMPGGAAKHKRWSKNRVQAFNGSLMHFMRALYALKLAEEGFNLRRLYRFLNPNRPTDAQIAAAREALRQKHNVPGLSISQDDSLTTIISKARLPKYIDQLDKNPVPYATYISKSEGKVVLGFEQYLQIVYTQEKEELGYVNMQSSLARENSYRAPGYQTSLISITGQPVTIEELGNFSEPLDLLTEGYWSWEKVGDMLPLNYQLPVK